ncbi:MAG: polyribonucleotide nucleotidyltransferase [Patescibacteria group bacterium]|nr:polyribonucleotide nucleotidyltransferase [Patescibacteria group bacterium]
MTENKLKRKIFETELNNEKISFEISGLAKQANAAVIGHYGDTAVLAVVVMSDKEVSGDFFPLTVDYEERFYAAGKILGSRYIRREGKSSDEATLSGRLVDRTIRPLFDSRLRREIQITLTVLAYDEIHDPDEIGLLATSIALGISDIPWNGPVGCIRVKNTDPQNNFRYQGFFAGPESKINMIEFEGMEIEEKEIETIFPSIQKEINRLVFFQKEIIKQIGKKKTNVVIPEPDQTLRKKVRGFILKQIETAIKNKTVGELKNLLFEELKQNNEPQENLPFIERIFEEEIDAYVHRQIIEHNNRLDGRKLDEIRPLYAETKLFNRTHGSAIFVRGDTQVLAVTTLGSPSAEQTFETMEGSGRKRFMLHYNFPKFSTGEVGRSRGPGRREIGHGALAAKAITNMIPSKEEFPYTIRVVAETLSSNGSSSMASTCAATLSLMDAGVPLKKPVTGIAMGLMLNKKGEYKILTDIQGFEDHYGDMDFKVAGTDKGITAIQVDVKIEGITEPIFKDALEGAKIARGKILKVLTDTLPSPRKELSKYAPKIITININPNRIGEVVGPGGKVINGIIAATENKVTIDIDQTGQIFIAGTEMPLVEKAKNMVEAIVKEYSVGETVEGLIVKILDFGAIVDLGGGQDGMLHVSELKEGFVKKVEDVVKIGDLVKVKIIRVDPDGRIGLSLKNVK